MATAGRSSSIIAFFGVFGILFLVGLWAMLQTEYTPARDLIGLSNLIRRFTGSETVKIYYDEVPEGKALVVRYAAAGGDPIGGSVETELGKIGRMTLEQFTGDRKAFAYIQVVRVTRSRGVCRMQESTEERTYAAPPPPVLPPARPPGPGGSSR